ncbi:hypothetical protein BJY04DRAFT_191088 [Aspergillus karnatakaensis]|uniref:uncharacterized protein n=1 Tax=Aspergillus karnatakaensis TaxID=1810916 RepID=UPI003CCE132B
MAQNNGGRVDKRATGVRGINGRECLHQHYSKEKYQALGQIQNPQISPNQSGRLTALGNRHSIIWDATPATGSSPFDVIEALPSFGGSDKYTPVKISPTKSLIGSAFRYRYRFRFRVRHAPAPPDQYQISYPRPSKFILTNDRQAIPWPFA